jgi:exodeoxyribonuclease VII small subunit
VIEHDQPLPIDRWMSALERGSFEEVLAALEEVVARLEEGRLALADSVDCYELGVRLADRCDRFLNEAELRVSRLETVADRLDRLVSRDADDG